MCEGYRDQFDGEWKMPVDMSEFTHHAGGYSTCFLDPTKHAELYKRVMTQLQHLPAHGFSVKKIEMVQNTAAERMFHGSIETVEKREKTPTFQPKLDIESNPNERRRVLDLVCMQIL
jgi:hypothetical protein